MTMNLRLAAIALLLLPGCRGDKPEDRCLPHVIEARPVPSLMREGDSRTRPELPGTARP